MRLTCRCLTLHDLRHQYASFLVNSSLSKSHLPKNQWYEETGQVIASKAGRGLASRRRVPDGDPVAGDRGSLCLQAPRPDARGDVAGTGMA